MGEELIDSGARALIEQALGVARTAQLGQFETVDLIGRFLKGAGYDVVRQDRLVKLEVEEIELLKARLSGILAALGASLDTEGT